MPTTSIDTFFACALMVLLVLSAMASTSKLLYPHINSEIDSNAAERYKSISEYLLLNEGTPSNWGQNYTATIEAFGLAKAESDTFYELDIDKVSRLNSENFYATNYAQVFTALGMSDVSLRIEIKPVFQVDINLTATFEEANETVYQFKVSTEKHGAPIQTKLKCYVAAESYLWTGSVYDSDGALYLNITIPNTINGPALLVAFAKSVSNTQIVSFNACAFGHNSAEPYSKNTFLRLSPLGYALNASYLYSGINLSKAYALTFNYSSDMKLAAASNQFAMFDIPHFLDQGPTLIIVAGYNSTTFFAEWTAYPQIPLQIGADFTASNLSNVFAYTYLVTVSSTIYECTIWLGGPRS